MNCFNSEIFLYEFPKIVDNRGNLSFIESQRHIPFDIKRVYYIYDVPGGAKRAGHAHKTLQQLLISVAGSFDVLLDNGRENYRFLLNRPDQGLYIPPLVWREIVNCASGSVCLALVSDFYDESDYYRDYAEFRLAVENEMK